MKSFFKYLLATIVGILISSIILFFIFLGVVSAIISSTEKEVTINSNSVLKIELNKPIPDRSSENPFEHFDYKNLKPNITLGLNDILKNIAEAKTDPKIKGIYLDLSMVPTGFGTIEEIRDALIDFKQSKKFIVSYADYYTQGAYYIATAADSIFLNPVGEVAFLGLRAEIMFYKGTFEKLEIEPEVIRHGKFKSAVEPFINDKMSPENREQLNTLLNGLWGHLIDGVSKQRHISKDELNRMADQLSIRSAKSALENKLIDGLRYKDEIRACLAKLSGAASEKKLEMVTLSQYNKAPKTKKDFPKDKIAVIYASGEINMGEGDNESIGSESLSKTIRDARSDSSIKAIVLRINSPGGSALASEIIWRELSLSEKVKPLIVSMGSVAASGGYYIASPADTIVADPTTITGSIGVFGMLLNVKNFMNKKLGVTTDVAQTNKHSDLGSIFRPLTAEEKEIIQSEVENIYDVFTTRVSDGRKLRKTEVDSIGQGRVWGAMDAKKIGLVDVIGGIDKAIEIAAKKAKLKNYRVTELPKQEDPLTEFLKDFSTKVRSNVIKSELGNEYDIYNNLKQALDRQGVVARIPYELNIY
ncbi:MAG TPA: signal peptide peptidase SppA [Bacteroidales bacterium]